MKTYGWPCAIKLKIFRAEKERQYWRREHGLDQTAVSNDENTKEKMKTGITRSLLFVMGLSALYSGFLFWW